MDTDLKDPRGKLRCLQQAEDEKLQKTIERVENQITKRVKENDRVKHGRRN